MLEFIVILIVEFEESEPFQPTNSYPSFGDAVIVTMVPSSYVPPEVETDPPTPAETARLYWVTVEVVRFTFGALVTSSLEHPNKTNNDSNSSLFISLI